MKHLNALKIFIVATLILVLSGCGSSRDSDGISSGSDTLANAQAIGINNCLSAQCHDPGDSAPTEWLAGNHANLGNFPDIGFFGTPNADTECAVCHDPNGDSANLLEDGLYDPADLSTVERPVVGCEACHGGGQFHNGVIAGLPYPKPDFNRCGQCHNETFDHNTHHPFADSIVENYDLGAHNDSIEAAHATPESIRAKCGRCHSDEGFRQYYPLTVDFTRDQLSATLDPAPDLTDVNPVQCRTCHDSHNNDLRVGSVIDSGSGLQVYSAQFRLCTACHNVFIDATLDAVVGNKFDYALDPVALGEDLDTIGPADGRNNHYHGFFLDMVQSHFDNPDTPEVEGYNINAADENACLNCHDAHGASKFEQAFASGIANEWGNEPGFHGDYKVEAFNHGFDETDSVCMECHNGTEAVKIYEGLTAAELDGQPARVIACVTCHDLTAKSADGTAFELGARRIFKDADGNQTTVHTFESGLTADLGLADADNLLCLNCHSGRKAGSSVDDEIAAKDLNGDGVADSGTFSFQNIHYRAAGATLFGNMAGGGYEFAGKAYASKFEHVDSNDLCIECHNVHSGELFLTDPGFGPTGCDNCHTNVVDTGNYATDVLAVRDIRMNGSLEDYDGDGNGTEGIYYEVEGLKADLLAAISGSGATVLGGYPYFGNLTNAAQLQAAYNYQVVDKDPGSYAHNGDYIIQLLYDSLEAMSIAFPGLGINMANYVREDSGHFASDGEPFRHWDEDPAMSTSCARCHSSEGAAAYFTNFTVTSDDFKPYTRGISAGLACESCHVAPFDATGTPPALRTPTTVEFPSGVIVDTNTPGAANLFITGNDSPLCMTCHQGRSSTDTVDARIAAGNLGFSNIHYYAAAASFFGNEVRGGYQYTGQTYASTMTFPGAHTTPGYFTCEGCHMDGAPSHDFKPLVSDCSGCHGFDGPGTGFEDLGGSPFANFTDIQTLKTELAAVLTSSGVTFLSGYPYFSNITTEQQLKAAYNWQFADKEPCGFIHNPDYVKQLLFDSITDMGGTPSVARP